MFSRFEKRGPFTVIGSEITAKCDDISNVIPPLIQKHLPRLSEVKNISHQDITYGIVFYKEEGVISYVFGNEVSKVEDIPEEMISAEIPEAEYAVIVHKGLIKKIHDSFQYFYGTWLKENGYESVGDKPFFEVYGNEFKGGSSEDSIMEIYFPIPFPIFSRIETKPAFTVIGSQVSSPCDELKTAIPGMLKTHLPRIPQIKNTTKADTAIGVIYPEKEGKITYIFAHEVSKVEDVPEGMISTEIPEAEYAVIIHKGLILNIKDAYKYFEETWLQENEYEKTADKPVLEVYGGEFKGGMSEDSVAEIYFPVQKKN